MSKPNVLLVLPPDHYVLRNMEPIRQLANVHVGADAETLARFGPDADVILYSGFVGGLPFKPIWQAAKNVSWVHSLSAGVESTLIPEFVNSPVPLTNARGVFAPSLAEFVIMGMLYFYKRVRRLVENQRTHKWDDFLVDWLRGKTMGVVGYGEIGRECARLAKALGVKIYATRRNPERSSGDPIISRMFASKDLHQMLAEVDVVLAAAPLTSETRHMLSKAEFAVMKPSAIVMNVGRGPVIDESALVEALETRKIAAAALDVYEVEPLPKESPLWDMENVLISPHCTDRTTDPDWLDLSAQAFVENFHRFINGEPLMNVVDKKAGY
ncbi:MAG: D-2-hydroxyacid dehydrogenase [Acidobacteriaceae bacterium]|nr:D-2-hydroxyacid dehydrogenase [Acidobacteriaceae bacterium]